MKTKHKRKPRKPIGRMHTPCPRCQGQRTFIRFSVFTWYGLTLYRLSNRLNWQWLAYRTCRVCRGKEYQG